MKTKTSEDRREESSWTSFYKNDKHKNVKGHNKTLKKRRIVRKSTRRSTLRLGGRRW